MFRKIVLSTVAALGLSAAVVAPSATFCARVAFAIVA